MAKSFDVVEGSSRPGQGAPSGGRLDMGAALAPSQAAEGVGQQIAQTSNIAFKLQDNIAEARIVTDLSKARRLMGEAAGRIKEGYFNNVNPDEWGKQTADEIDATQKLVLGPDTNSAVRRRLEPLFAEWASKVKVEGNIAATQTSMKNMTKSMKADAQQAAMDQDLELSDDILDDAVKTKLLHKEEAKELKKAYRVISDIAAVNQLLLDAPKSVEKILDERDPDWDGETRMVDGVSSKFLNKKHLTDSQRMQFIQSSRVEVARDHRTNVESIVDEYKSGKAGATRPISEDEIMAGAKNGDYSFEDADAILDLVKRDEVKVQGENVEGFVGRILNREENLGQDLEDLNVSNAQKIQLERVIEAFDAEDQSEVFRLISTDIINMPLDESEIKWSPDKLKSMLKDEEISLGHFNAIITLQGGKTKKEIASLSQAAAFNKAYMEVQGYVDDPNRTPDQIDKILTWAKSKVTTEHYEDLVNFGAKQRTTRSLLIHKAVAEEIERDKKASFYGADGNYMKFPPGYKKNPKKPPTLLDLTLRNTFMQPLAAKRADRVVTLLIKDLGEWIHKQEADGKPHGVGEQQQFKARWYKDYQERVQRLKEEHNAQFSGYRAAQDRDVFNVWNLITGNILDVPEKLEPGQPIFEDPLLNMDPRFAPE